MILVGCISPCHNPDCFALTVNLDFSVSFASMAPSAIGTCGELDYSLKCEELFSETVSVCVSLSSIVC